MLASASGELKTRVEPNLRCRPCVTLKTPPLPEHRCQRVLAAAVRHVFAEHDDARVARHLVLQRAIDRRDHRVRACLLALPASRTLRRRIDVGREDVEADRIDVRLRRLNRAIRGVVHFAVDVVADRGEVFVGRQPFGLQQFRELDERIARRFLGAFRRRLVELFVVRQRVRVRPDDLARARAPGPCARARRRWPRPWPRSWRGSRCRRCSEPASRETTTTSREISPPAVCTSTGTEIA